MANDMNQCTFVGRLARDPESRTFQNGDGVTNFTIAVGSAWKDRATGESKESVEWVNIVATGGLSKIAAQYLKKGSQVLVSGKLRTRKWTDQSGQERYSTEIRADSMQMLGGKSEGQAPSPRQAPQPQRQAPVQRAASGFDDSDDIPWN